MDLLKACDEMKVFIETAQKLVDAWDEDPDNYSQLEEGLSALKDEVEKFKDLSKRVLSQPRRYVLKQSARSSGFSAPYSSLRNFFSD